MTQCIHTAAYVHSTMMVINVKDTIFLCIVWKQHCDANSAFRHDEIAIDNLMTFY